MHNYKYEASHVVLTADGYTLLYSGIITTGRCPLSATLDRVLIKVGLLQLGASQCEAIVIQ